MMKKAEGLGGAPATKDKKMRIEPQRGATDRARGQVDPRIQTEIGKHLRAIYDDVINEPVPSKFMDLLEKLERSTQKS